MTRHVAWMGVTSALFVGAVTVLLSKVLWWMYELEVQPLGQAATALCSALGLFEYRLRLLREWVSGGPWDDLPLK